MPMLTEYELEHYSDMNTCGDHIPRHAIQRMIEELRWIRRLDSVNWQNYPPPVLTEDEDFGGVLP